MSPLPNHDASSVDGATRASSVAKQQISTKLVGQWKDMSDVVAVARLACQGQVCLRIALVADRRGTWYDMADHKSAFLELTIPEHTKYPLAPP